MLEREYLLNLYEIYKKLLSDREKTYFEYYYYEDYSMQEIADVYEVSKSYVAKYLNQICSKLEKYEESLEINNKNNKIKNIIHELKDEKLKNKLEELI